MSSMSGSGSDTISTATPPTYSQSDGYSTSSDWIDSDIAWHTGPNHGIGYTVKKEVSAKENETDESSLCESDSDVTTSDTISAIERNAHWKESDFIRDFTDPQIDHDRVLLVGGNDLHVISSILMETSDFFKILFGENFKESIQEKIELKEVVADDFIEFLNHLYSNNRKITKDNFLPLFTLADRFLTPLIFKKCNDFIKKDPIIMNDFGQRAFDLLQMAIDMDLKDFKVLSLSSMYFRTLFQTNLVEENLIEVSLPDVSADSFQHFLRIVYPGHYSEDCGMIETTILIELVSLSFRFLCPVVLKEAKRLISLRCWHSGVQYFDIVKLIELVLLHEIEELKDDLKKSLRHPECVAKQHKEIMNAPEHVRYFILAAFVEEKIADDRENDGRSSRSGSRASSNSTVSSRSSSRSPPPRRARLDRPESPAN